MKLKKHTYKILTRLKWKILRKIKKITRFIPNLRNKIKLRIGMAQEFGWRALWDEKYKENKRRIGKNRARNLRNKRLYGNNWAKKAPCYRRRIIARDGNKCFWCNGVLGVQNATIDHIHPVGQGGAGQDIKNMRLIHNHCRVERDRLIYTGVLKLDL